MIGNRVGPYEITAKLGEGGMGEVYRATDSKLHREVAIKLLPAAFVADDDRLARFEREAQLLAQLNHPHIAQIYGMESSGDSHALVMELVEGPTLAERLESGPLPLDETLSLATQIAEALEEAHEKGIIHRDLKPLNIKASREGKVKILDFGLAKAMEPHAGSAWSASDLTQSPTETFRGTRAGVILGTAAYMAPEQAQGGRIDKRADIWAFGVVLWEMLTGRRLFAGDTVPETLAEVLKTEIDLAALPEKTPAAVRRLLRRCLQRRPKDRLRDVGDARIVLTEAVTGQLEPIDARVGPPAGSPSMGWVLAAALAAFVALAAGYAIGRRGVSEPAARTGTAASPSFQKLTFQPGEELEPTLSPDGESLYFVVRNEPGVGSDIAFLPVGSRKAINLTADSPADNRTPAVSPEGRRIAFRSERDGGGIFLMGTTGESVRRLTDGCFDPAWSPDGNEIVCTTCPAADPFARGCRGTLRIVDVATGASREVDTGDAAAPAWSPDGRRIAYWGAAGDESGWRDLWAVDVAGGEPIELTHDPAVDWSPAWSADGSAVFFLSDRGGSPNLWTLSLDPASGRPRGSPRSVVLPTEFAGEIRRGGSRWGYVSRSPRATIEQRTFDPERLELLGEPHTIVDLTSRIGALAISPDARRIAYTTVLPRQDLFTVDIGGGAPVQLTDDQANDRFPSWDPNGQRILFMSNRGGRYEIRSIGADGGGLEQLTRTTDESRWAPILSPHRSRLATQSELGTTVFDASGPPPWKSFERLPNPAEPAGAVFKGVAWSPDEEQLAGDLGTGPGSRRVAIWSFRDRRLRVFELEGAGFAWLPDGRRILATGRTLSVLDPATGTSQPIAGSSGISLGTFPSLGLGALVSFSNHEEADIWLAEGIE